MKQFKFNCNNKYYYRYNLHNELEFPRNVKQEQNNSFTLLFSIYSCSFESVVVGCNWVAFYFLFSPSAANPAQPSVDCLYLYSITIEI